MHKGQAGRIGVVGGSEDYTGAPFFSGIASMKVGVDLCHIFCEPGAGTVCYKINKQTNIHASIIDLIVHPYMRTKEKLEADLSIDKIVDRVSSVFSRLHVLVVGPGLSRDEVMQETTRHLIQRARKQNMAIVIDADGLYLVQQHPEAGVEGSGEEAAKKLAQSFGGLTVVQKGSEDCITNGSEVLKCDTEGGDILSGAIAAFLAWGKAYEDGVWRSVLTSHMLEEIGSSYDQFMKH
ncbi:Ribokinase-like protein [Gilbertella persicaria]|uniref:Ribokinase-like protein n=1 Tax=Gilbertella persicaria TaxID=101096 RepID=UPI00222008A9|nr:Ribokinase-like protein [Gilbertella persicaria]KAI8098097.1 Ribokinase-like protein [Gilbertella persicaria]